MSSTIGDQRQRSGVSETGTRFGSGALLAGGDSVITPSHDGEADRIDSPVQTPDDTPQSPVRRTRWRFAAPLATIAGIASAGIAAAALLSHFMPTKSVSIATVEVSRGPLRVFVTESGQLDSANNVSVISQCEWDANLLSIVPEGTQVEEGQIICELDSSGFRDYANEKLVELTESESAVRQAEEAVKIQQAENDRLTAAAQLLVEMAALDLREFEEGSFVQQQDSLEGECRLAEEALNQARERYIYAKRMSGKGYQTQSDLEQARLSVSRAEIELRKARDNKKLLEQFTAVRTLAELKANLVNSKLELARVKLQARLAMSQVEIALSSQKQLAQHDRDRYERAMRNIAACTIRAPQSGKIVYRIYSLRSSQPRSIEEGIEVDFREELMRVPDYSRMQVEIDIHETQIMSIEEGLPVTIYVEALGRNFRGVVDSISSIPSRRYHSNYVSREFETIVEITDDVSQETGIMPGMTADVRVLVSNRDSVLQAPSNSIITIGEKAYAFVMTQNGPQPKSVVIGETDDASIEIIEGLSEGDVIAERPRIELADEIIRLESRG